VRVPQFPYERRSCPVAACSTPGGLGTTCARFGGRRIPHRPFWARCLSHFHLLLVTTPQTQVPRVSIGHRTGRSTALWLAEAELLSAGFRPRRVPPLDACCVVLISLSRDGSSMEQSFILLKGARQSLAKGSSINKVFIKILATGRYRGSGCPRRRARPRRGGCARCVGGVGRARPARPARARARRRVYTQRDGLTRHMAGASFPPGDVCRW